MDNTSNDRGYTQQQAYPMQQQRDTYGLPYANTYNPNYRRTNSNRSNNDSYYDSDQYNQNYHASVPDNSNNNNDLQPRYYNGYEDSQAMQQQQQGQQGQQPPHRSSMHSNTGSHRSKPNSVQLLKPERERSKCLPCFPCIRSTCGRVTCCLCILLLLVIIVIVILVFAVFKMPTVDYLGTVGDPVFTFNTGNTTLGLSMVANIQVKNPNPIGFNFESIVATAYYPGYGPSIGGGNITNVSFPSKTTKTIQFPAIVSYDRHQDPGFTVVESILSKCGFTGATNGQIQISYDIKATLKIIGISFSPSLKNQSTSFACPVNIAQIASGIPGSIISGIGGLIGH